MSGKRILVADDKPEVARGMRDRLVCAGYEVTMALDGLQVTMQAIASQPDLILLDIGMPAGTGHVVAERLRMIDATCRIPIIVLTPGCGAQGGRAGGAAGQWRSIAKPLDPQALLAAVEKELGADGTSH